MRLDLSRPQRGVGGVLERHRHHLGRAVDGDLAEKLKPVGGTTEHGRVVRPRLHVDDLRPKGQVDRVLEPSAGMDRAGDKFPERIEVLERGLVRIEIVRPPCNARRP